MILLACCLAAVLTALGPAAPARAAGFDCWGVLSVTPWDEAPKPAVLADSPADGVGVRLGVYDVAGAHVASLVDGEQRAGAHAVTFRGARLPSGVYFCRLRAGSRTARLRLLLVR